MALVTRTILRVLLVTALLTAAPSQRGLGQPVGEYEVKAAFLYNFVKFVEWPAPAANRANLSLCVLGDDSFAALLAATVADKTVQHRQLTVRRVSQPDEVLQCHVLFVGTVEPVHSHTVLEAIRDTPVLTVGDTEDFIEHGGMIAFRVEQQKVRFVINSAAVGRSGLNISSQLLKLAAAVIPPQPPPP